MSPRTASHKFVTSLIGMAFAAILFPSSLEARPEYAVKVKSSCVSCHATPWGGGPRTVYGKFYGSHNQGMAKTSGSDLYYGDFRMVGFYPAKPSQRTNGIALMEAAASANVPLIENPEGSEFRTVATFNFSPLASSAREVYGRWRPYGQDNGPIGYVTFGRINSPFGLLTDEHRTYTKLQTASSLNSFNNGIVMTGNLLPPLGYDLALLSDQQSSSFNNGGLTWASVLNFRFNPQDIPFLVGFSAQYEGMTTQPAPYAGSLYGVLSLENWTGGNIPLTLLMEGTLARNWNSAKVNPGLSSFFIPPSASLFQSAVAESQSRGIQFASKLAISDQWTLFYKFDYLALDSRYLSDAFSRHGIGVGYTLNSNLSVDTRVEKSRVGRPEIVDANTFGATDALIAMVRLWI